MQFRAWDRESERMIEWGEILLNWEMSEFNSGSLFWMQDTRLEDKHGRAIYEGDILRTKGVDGDQLWVVSYEMSSYVMGFDLNNVAKKFSCVHNHVWEEGVVAGNIYENKEMITSKAGSKKRLKHIA